MISIMVTMATWPTNFQYQSARQHNGYYDNIRPISPCCDQPSLDSWIHCTPRKAGKDAHPIQPLQTPSSKKSCPTTEPIPDSYRPTKKTAPRNPAPLESPLPTSPAPLWSPAPRNPAPLKSPTLSSQATLRSPVPSLLAPSFNPPCLLPPHRPHQQGASRLAPATGCAKMGCTCLCQPLHQISP